MPNVASISVTVCGRVQGVFFRAFVMQHATSLGLTGYVRNLSDGKAVEVRAEGEREQLEELLKHLNAGSPGARVDKLEVNWSEYTGGFSGFEVRY